MPAPSHDWHPLPRWSFTELVLRGAVAFISAATVWRTLAKDASGPGTTACITPPKDLCPQQKCWGLGSTSARELEATGGGEGVVVDGDRGGHAALAVAGDAMEAPTRGTLAMRPRPRSLVMSQLVRWHRRLASAGPAGGQW